MTSFDGATKKFIRHTIAAVLLLGAVTTFADAATISVELTSRGLGIGTSAYNDSGTVDVDVVGKIITEGAPGSGLGSKLTVETTGLAGAGTGPNPLLMTVTAKSHLDNTGTIPPDFLAGVIYLSDGDGVAPIVYKDEGLGVRSFTVNESTGERLFSSGRARIEGSKEVSGGTDFTTFATRGNGPPHVDESVLFDFNPNVAVLAASTSFLLTKFDSGFRVNLSVKLADGTVIDTPIDATHQSGVRPVDAPTLLTVVGPAGDKIYKVNLSVLPGITANTLLDSVTIRAVDDNPASPSGTAEHFLINGMTTDTTDLPTIGLSDPLSGLSIVGCAHTLGATVTNTTAGLGALDYTVSAAITLGSGDLGAVAPADGTLNPGESQAHTASFTGNVGLNEVTFTVTSPQASNSPQTIVSSQTVLDHSDAQFQDAATPGAGLKTFANDNNELTINFGTLLQGINGGSVSSLFDILAAITTTGFTAGLDLDLLSTIQSSPAFSLLGFTDFVNMGSSETEGYSVLFDTNTPGTFLAEFEFAFSDQDLPCATDPGSEKLRLIVRGEIQPADDDNPASAPEPGTLTLAIVGLLGMSGVAARRRKGCRAAGVGQRKPSATI